MKGITHLLGAMPGIGNKLELGLGEALVEGPRSGGGADNVVATLDNEGGDVADLVDIIEDLRIGAEEALVCEEVALDPSKGKGPLILGGLGDLDRIDVELTRGTF
jgi:hypothetical protein